ncbi:Geranylgeranyl pyrophosphate synthase Short=GGPP synthase; Short=GGPPSase; AltName: Full=(2E,6E)-farnesyl diphosphate synthase; AltName: Full=Dimethylallyltranstransferase; AltName: Full=Farnesyl diphosphate synthase; AltName: Full=Farnesyltranstransferase; AltName: Full=Geranylgeranyl diphosphate synthase; AltName: Full=Geranyltranstransferase [Serendipita indica DSM 11827]|uniref:(2E,6E)-farnesyl diphosphate synthase n=1 Tax=Serendipita indica (strain DSM 11827) TaxID=1109443 RepID=G4TEU3_SERID|nr:Geranylgeranyl pyrophosphate synthase Short=GGPP synthase; Short=GGPPSase; AltName: Full=(2E,6E)-farnesyl diphosphate synthase; AltName: Full=Dimethylallyltranstransferase; AltName: Full=Farnesyl diphosphate synthase; AltName: Full=Farnesyltranstransferase; AltName: Full=Geranylgeranyl diphosphate synthase; AltName: Full=Geranyltranstransferase [Serendipita indica DSM 11827]CCA69831.1 probable farnesyltranstransferase (al-3) [Serendipita indica DSM 11827]
MQIYDNFVNSPLLTNTWSPAHEAILLEPYTYMTSQPGKDFRTKMTAAFNDWLKVPEEQLSLIAKIVQMLHNASLLMDDVEDDAQMRRGIPVAHKIYGVPQTINSANYVYFLAYKELFALRASDDSHEGLDEIVNEEFLNLHRGQGLEMFWRDSLQCPTEEEYISMVNNKTGGLLRLAVKLMMAKSESEINYVPLVNLIGVYFQIRDDYMNLQSDQALNKGFAEDLTEGKFSFPVVHAIRSSTSNRQIINVLQKRPSTPTTKRYAVEHMKRVTHSFAYTRSVLNILDKQIREEVHRLGGNSKLEALLDQLTVPDADDDEASE